MAEWAVVAIPADDNPIWRISSEKIPHMTLLYFGEQSDPTKASRVTEYLEHMVKNSMVRFGLEVDFRGTLGPKDADVLFFHEDFSLRNVQDHRAQMLQQPDMFEMYNSIEQFPEWTPHLTLGYPDAPAKKLDKDTWYPSWIHFDKIAFWTNDFDGPEFQIPWNKGLTTDVAWSAIRHTEFTKEQRKKLAEKKEAMSDGSFPIRNVADLRNAIQAYGRAKNKDKAKAWIKKRAKALQAESYLPEEWMADTAAQSDLISDLISQIVEDSKDIKHHGIKGQKWGVRRTQKQIEADSEDVASVKKAREKIKENKTTDVLSNKELQQVVTRLNLEQQYKNLTTSKNKEFIKGENFIKDLIKTGKTINDATSTVALLQNNLGPILRDAASAASKRASHSEAPARKKKVSTGSLSKKDVRRREKNPYSGPIGDM